MCKNYLDVLDSTILPADPGRLGEANVVKWVQVIVRGHGCFEISRQAGMHSCDADDSKCGVNVNSGGGSLWHPNMSVFIHSFCIIVFAE